MIVLLYDLLGPFTGLCQKVLIFTVAAPVRRNTKGKIERGAGRHAAAKSSEIVDEACVRYYNEASLYKSPDARPLSVNHHRDFSGFCLYMLLSNQNPEAFLNRSG